VSDELESGPKLLKHELRWQPQDREPSRLKRPVPALVSTALARVMCTVDLNHQPRCRSNEVEDETAPNDLAAKLDTELGGAERLPQHALRLRWCRAHAMGMCG
jgi:hypothetical protein